MKDSPIMFCAFIFFISLVCSGSVYGEKKKLFYVNSYHKGYQWSDEIEKGLLKALAIKSNPDGSYDTSKSKVCFRSFRMNTKLYPSEYFIKQAALSAKRIIDDWAPDIVVASDDNASRYLIAPYYKNKKIPFVFCGLNWDANVYGFPVSNITGMVEVEPVFETISLLKKFAKGDRVGYIGVNRLSERKSLNHYKENLKIVFSDGKLVDDFSGWQNEYLRLQDSVDMLIWLNATGIKGWQADKAMAFIQKHSKIPSGTVIEGHTCYALLGRVKIAGEQGWWAGKTALKILNGASPADIPVTINKESKIYLNMRLAKRLGIKFPVALLERATFTDSLKD